MKKIIWGLLALSFLGCKKDETLALPGKWRWEYVKVIELTPQGTVESYNVSSSSYSDEYFIEFDQKGKVRLYKNDQIIEKYRLIFDEKYSNTILLDKVGKKNDKSIGVYKFHTDSLKIVIADFIPYEHKPQDEIVFTKVN